MDKYNVQILKRAYNNIDEIYAYISKELVAPDAAIKLVEKLEEAINSLELMPRRFPFRRTGLYSNRGYRQVFIDNYTIIFRINETDKIVTVVAVKYLKSLY